MPKSNVTYWNPLSPDNDGKWIPVFGFEGAIEELTLSHPADIQARGLSPLPVYQQIWKY